MILNSAPSAFINNISIAKNGDRDMSKRIKRYSLSLREHYSDALDGLVESGIYYEPQEVIREALRVLFDRYGIAPFKVEASG